MSDAWTEEFKDLGGQWHSKDEAQAVADSLQGKIRVLRAYRHVACCHGVPDLNQARERSRLPGVGRAGHV